MNKYGLTEGRSQVKLSPLAQRIVANPNEADKQAALKDLVFKIPLWKDIYEKYGSNPSVQDIRIALQNITKIDNIKAEQEAEDISKLYMDAVSYINDKEGNTMYSQANETAPQGMMTQTAYRNIDFEDIHIKIPKDDMNSIETAIQLLEMLKKKEAKTEKKEGKRPKE